MKLRKIPAGLMFWFSNSITTRHFTRKKTDIIERMRVSSARSLGARIGKDSNIRKGQFITNFSLLELGERVTLGPFCRLFLFDTFKVGDDVEIGSGLTVHTSEHELTDKDRPLGKQGTRFGQVRIGSDVYIGSNVTILIDTEIESRVVVAAGSVVRGKLASGYVYGGVPARQLRALD